MTDPITQTEAEKAARGLEVIYQNGEDENGDPVETPTKALLIVGAEIVRALGRIEAAIRETAGEEIKCGHGASAGRCALCWNAQVKP